MNQSAIQYILDEKGNHTRLSLDCNTASWKPIESELETAYLLKSETMKRRLLEAKNRSDGIPFEIVCEKILGKSYV